MPIRHRHRRRWRLSLVPWRRAPCLTQSQGTVAKTNEGSTAVTTTRANVQSNSVHDVSMLGSIARLNMCWRQYCHDDGKAGCGGGGGGC